MPDPDLADPAAALPVRSLWQRRITDPIVAQLTQGLTPDKIALTIAIGSVLSMFPILGTTTLLCLVVGTFLKLNQPIIQAANFACTPIHLPFIYFALTWGDRLFGAGQVFGEMGVMRRELIEHPLQFIQRYSVAGLYAIGVWAVLVPIWGTAVFYTARPILRGIERSRLATAARLAAEKARDHPVP